MSMCPPQYPCHYCGATEESVFPRFIDNAPKWQPIETAPKDKIVLLYSKRNFRSVTTGMVDAKLHNTARETGGVLIDPMPTHWMPLPNPPLTDSKVQS